MKRLNWKEGLLTGDISYRILKNYCRLEGKIYRPDTLFFMEKNGWPGDWEGRTILALVLCAKITGREPAYLDRIIKRLSDFLNCSGYMGEEYREGFYNEQQLAGHNWLLRGLMAYATWKDSEEAWRMVSEIVDNLYKPAAGAYGDYPVKKRNGGKASGYIKSKAGNWYISTDTGCAFICMDALAEYYEKTKDEAVKEMLEEMCRKFFSIDFVKISAQTHAILTALRGILRFYENVGEEECLKNAVDIYELYIREGMTANYANQNWFGRPEWTEPCAIVDSYMVSMKLFQYTRNVRYIDLAHRIYYNALCFAQRYNGGFGCDVCTGWGSEVVKAKGDIFEAFWCCTMRGAEGLFEVASDTVWIVENDIWILNQNNIEIMILGIYVRLVTEYPEKGLFHLKVSGGRECLIKIYIPEYARQQLQYQDTKGSKLNVSGDFLVIEYDGMDLDLRVKFEIPYWSENITYGNISYIRYWRGEQILGKIVDDGIKSAEDIRNNVEREKWKTLDSLVTMENKIENMNEKLQILFAE